MGKPAVVYKLEWQGRKIERNMNRATARAMGYVIARCVRHAKRNHPGWKSRSGRAEKSVRKLKISRESGKSVGEWGSTLFYVRFLEMNHGAFMRKAADANYKFLAPKISEFFNEQLRAS